MGTSCFMLTKLKGFDLQLFVNKASHWYLAMLFTWFGLYLVFGDGFGYLGLVNALSVYLFVPLPIVLFIALRANRRWILLAGLAASAIFAWLWGPLFWPNAAVDASLSSLRVMTFNVLGRAGDFDQVLASIEAENPDVLFLQEFTPEFAGPITAGLSEEYPYQVLNPQPRANGLGVFSRYPLEPIDVVIDGNWRGTPQVLQLNWQGESITLVNFHALSTGGVWPGLVRHTTRERDEAFGYLADFVNQQSGPVILAGDANMTRQNNPYRVLDERLDDAWWEAGWGFGHTFPGSLEPGDLFTRVSLFFIPYWLVRIDYVFYSEEFQASNAWLAEYHSGSDHSGVVADLVFRGD